MTEFIAEADESRHDLLRALDATIRKAAPELNVERDGRFLGYGKFHYRYASGREGDTFAVSMMNGAQAVSVYLMCDGDGRWLPEANAERLGRVSVGKSCVRIRRLEHVELDVLAELVRAAADQHADAML